MTDLDAFLDDLSSAAPVPGGGSVAALQVAMGASLVAMVANLTLGRKRFVSAWERAQLTLDDATRLRDEAIGLVDLDSAAYSRVADAMAMPRGTDEEKAARRARLQESLRDAAEPPLQTMRAAIDVIRLAADLVDFGNPNAISDVGTAALAAGAGYHAARLNVEINVSALAEQSWARAIREAMRPLTDPRETVEGVVARVEAVIRGEDG